MDEETRLALEGMGLTPEQIQSVLNLGVLAGEVPIQERMEAQASALRKNPVARGPRGRWTGETYTAADPTEFAAAALGSGVAAFEEQKARQRQMEILGQQARQREQYMNALVGALRNPAGPQSPTGMSTVHSMGTRPGTSNYGYSPMK